MTDLQIKIKLIYGRFLLIAAAFIPGYTFLNWYLVIKTGCLPLSELVANMLLPLGLPFVPVIIWLLPRIKLLQFKNSGSKDPAGFYVLIAAITIAVPAVIAQQYITTATGQLTVLANINDINKQPLTKYYRLQQHTIDKRQAQLYFTKQVTGKNNANLVFGVYVVCPVLGVTGVPVDGAAIITLKTIKPPKAWLGISYSKTISNRLSAAEKDTLYKEFLADSYSKFKFQNLDDFVYLDRIGRNDRHDNYNNALQKVTTNNGPSPIVFEPVYEPFEARNGDKLFWLLVSFAIGAGVFFLMLPLPLLNKEKARVLLPYDIDMWSPPTQTTKDTKFDDL